MPVYIIRAGDTEFVKIGWAVNVERRRKTLQAGCWAPLHVIRTIDGPPPLERWLHRYFRQYRQFGEWYSFRPEMLTVSAEDTRPAPKAPPQMAPELRNRIASSMRASWRDGSLCRTLDQQRASRAAQAAA